MNRHELPDNLNERKENNTGQCDVGGLRGSTVSKAPRTYRATEDANLKPNSLS